MKRIISTILIFSILMSILVTGTYAVSKPMNKDEVYNYYKQVEQNIVSSLGNLGYAKDPNSSTLAWAASYMLESYYQMYRTTGDVNYLIKLGTQFKAATKNLRDELGNGSLGWDCDNYSTVRITNPTFNTAAGWQILEGTPANAVYFNANSSGTGLRINSDGLSNPGVTTTLTKFSPSKVYNMHVVGRVTQSAVGRFYLKDLISGQVIPSVDGKEYQIINNSATTTYDIHYIIPETAQNVAVYLDSVGDYGSIFFDVVRVARANQFLVHEAMMMAPAAKFIKTVKEDKYLTNHTYDADQTLGQLADSFLPIIETIVQKWENEWRNVGEDMGVYIWPLNDEGSEFPGNALPHNQYGKMISVLLPLYSITNKPQYLDHATRMLRFLKSKMQLVTQNGRELYYWHYYDHAFEQNVSQSESTEDISHGALEVEAAITGYEYNLIFNETDLKRMANTFLETLWNGSTTDPVTYQSIVYNPSAQGYHKEQTSELAIRDWVRLAKWEPSIADGVSAFFNKNAGNQGKGHPAKLLTYAYLNDVLPGFVTNFTFSKVSGNSTQVVGTESAVTYQATLTPGATSSDYEMISWRVEKDGEVFGPSSTGKSFTFTPNGVGTYTVYGRYRDTLAEIVKVTEAPATQYSIAIEKIGGDTNQIVEKTVSFKAVLTPSANDTEYARIQWSIKKDNINYGEPIIGKNVTFTPSGIGTYTLTASIDGVNSLPTTITVANLIIIKTSGSSMQTAGTESPVSMQVSFIPAMDTFDYAGIVWSVSKNGSAFGTNGNGKTFTFTPSGVGTYVVTVSASGKNFTTSITVTAASGSGGSGGGGSGGGGSSSGSAIQTPPEKESDIMTTYNANSKTQVATVNAAFLEEQQMIKCDTVLVQVEQKEGAENYTIKIPAKKLMNTNGHKLLKLNTPIASTTVGIQEFSDYTKGPDSEYIELRVKKEKEDSASISMLIGGKEFKSKNARVTLPFTSDVDCISMDHIVLFSKTSDNDWKPIVKGRYMEQDKGITADVTIPGTYMAKLEAWKFSDIDCVPWAEEAIDVLAIRGVINGTSKTEYSPNDQITRADFVTLLIRTMGLTASSNEMFSDIAPEDYYYAEISAAKALGVINGTDGKFNPKDKISRQDMMTMTARAMEASGIILSVETLDGFTDSGDVSSYASNAVAKLIKAGIVTGSGERLNPNGKTTRAEAAVILYRLWK